MYPIFYLLKGDYILATEGPLYDGKQSDAEFGSPQTFQPMNFDDRQQ